MHFNIMLSRIIRPRPRPPRPSPGGPEVTRSAGCPSRSGPRAPCAARRATRPGQQVPPLDRPRALLPHFFRARSRKDGSSPDLYPSTRRSKPGMKPYFRPWRSRTSPFGAFSVRDELHQVLVGVGRRRSAVVLPCRGEHTPGPAHLLEDRSPQVGEPPGGPGRPPVRLLQLEAALDPGERILAAAAFQAHLGERLAVAPPRTAQSSRWSRRSPPTSRSIRR